MMEQVLVYTWLIPKKGTVKGLEVSNITWYSELKKFCLQGVHCPCDTYFISLDEFHQLVCFTVFQNSEANTEINQQVFDLFAIRIHATHVFLVRNSGKYGQLATITDDDRVMFCKRYISGNVADDTVLFLGDMNEF